MRVIPTSERRMGEERRYFPDWIDLVLENGPELEADRNSYLAGGYAEEFGYMAQPGYTRGVPLLDGESPELCREGHCQAGATHPGYPLRPHPLAQESETVATVPARRPVRNAGAAESSAGHGGYVSISNHSDWHAHASASRRAAIRFAAALVSLRWSFPRR